VIRKKWKNNFLYCSHNKSVKPIKIIRRKQLWQTMQTTAAMQTMRTTQTMRTIPARILPAPRIAALRIPARMQAIHRIAIIKRR
jgi:hypothetical protein